MLQKVRYIFTINFAAVSKLQKVEGVVVVQLIEAKMRIQFCDLVRAIDEHLQLIFVVLVLEQNRQISFLFTFIFNSVSCNNQIMKTQTQMAIDFFSNCTCYTIAYYNHFIQQTIYF